MKTYEPVYDENAVALVFSMNDRFAACFSVALSSIIAHASSERKYDILVFSSGVSEDKKRILFRQVSRYSGFSLRFIDSDELEGQFKGARTDVFFPVAVYLRLLIPELFPSYKKILYLDCDLVALQDVGILYDTDLSGYAIGACRDAGVAGMAGGYETDEKARLEQELQLVNPFDYFNSGVLILDIGLFSEMVSFNQMLSYAQASPLRYCDQDVLNHFSQGKVLFLDMAWNTLVDSEGIRANKIVPFAPDDIQADYRNAYAHPKIVHFAGPQKPWNNQNVDYRDCFWEAARRSPLYEDLLWQMSSSATAENSLVTSMQTNIQQLYFDDSEGERIRHDLHLRLSMVEIELEEEKNNTLLRRVKRRIKKRSAN